MMACMIRTKCIVQTNLITNNMLAASNGPERYTMVKATYPPTCVGMTCISSEHI